MEGGGRKMRVQFSSVAQLCPTLHEPINCSTPGLPVHHQLQEFTQTHVHQVSDAIQPSHSLSSPSPSALNLSQHQGIFKWVSSSHQMAKVLEFQLQYQSFQWIFRIDFLYFPLDWFDLLAIQGSLESLLQHHNSKVSIFRHSAFYMVQLSQEYYHSRVIKANKEPQPSSVRTTNGPDPLGMKFCVTQWGKEPWSLRCLLRAKGIWNR